jgi:hypothetical protein
MEQPLDPRQSLRLIDETIREAKRSFQKIHFHFLLWGVLFALAGIASYLLMQAGSAWHWVGWPAMGILGGIISGVRGAREGRAQGVSTTMDRLHMWLWTTYTITLLLVLVGSVPNRLDPNPWVLVLTGLPTFVTGAMMRFRPLMVGGVIFWVAGTLLFFTMHAYSPLVFSVAITLGYIVPGLMLKKEEHGLRSA